MAISNTPNSLDRAISMLTTFKVMTCACSASFLFTSSTGYVSLLFGDLVVSSGQLSDPGNKS